MSKIYRVTPKNGKFVIQLCSDRSTVKVAGSPFTKKTDAENAMFQLIQKSVPSTSQPGVPSTSQPGVPSTSKPGITFNQAFKKFAEWKLSLYSEDGRVSLHSLSRYDQEYRLRISKYMNANVLLSEFGIEHMEQYLDNLKAAGTSFKAMKKSVKDIKHFLRRANAVNLKPNLSMLTYKIYDHLAVLPEDDNEYFAKEVDINYLDQDKVNEIWSGLYEGLKSKNQDAINTFAIFSMMYFFGLRASELAGIKKDFHHEHSCLDLENGFLRIRGIWQNHRYKNRTKKKGSRRNIEIEMAAAKFLEMWLSYRSEYKPDNVWLLPGKNGNPFSYAYIRDMMWQTYAKHGLATIERNHAGHVRVISSPIKGFVTKIFRHRLSTHLINAMNTNPLMNQNKVKNVIGHTLFSTTANIYGNKLIKGTKEEREAFAKVKALANKSNLFFKIINK
jgi:integrase